MKKLLVAVLGLALLVPVLATAQVILRTTTRNNALVPAGESLVPTAAGIGIPRGTANVRLTASATNWPVAGVTVGIDITRDSGHTWESCYGPQHLDKPPVDKLGVLPPVAIECGWNADNPDIVQPTAGRVYLNNPSGSFRSDINLFYIGN